MEGLAYLHSFDPPIAHRDVKGTNVLVDDHLNCRLADLGLSSIPELSQRSRDHAVGTPAWMAPEILAPPEHGRIDLFKVDVYALGITAYEVLAGKPPIHDTSTAGVVLARLLKHETFRFPPSIFSPFLSQFIDSLCDIDPDKRLTLSVAVQRFESRLLFPRKFLFLGENDSPKVSIEAVKARPSKIPRYNWQKPESGNQSRHNPWTLSAKPPPLAVKNTVRFSRENRSQYSTTSGADLSAVDMYPGPAKALRSSPGKRRPFLTTPPSTP
ncbi:hypothetical protein AN958_04467 [Leucoagaricus sp. SymC.cos]|nr:hypothetical protein AN958_04467 [Leucoagaricus sp. SymC.cos]